MPVIECDVDGAREQLEAAGAAFDAGNTEHERWRASLGDATAIAYDGKVVIQGAEPSSIESVLRGDNGRGHLYFDGASRGNPGPAAIGWVLVSGDGIVAEEGTQIGRATNNQAEYEALIRGLQAALNYGFDEIHARGDSELVVEQVRGNWDVNNIELRERRVTVHELLEEFDEWSITHVPRTVNERADSLASDAFDDG